MECGQQWDNGYHGPHTCEREKGHNGKHRCHCGATKD